MNRLFIPARSTHHNGTKIDELSQKFLKSYYQHLYTKTPLYLLLLLERCLQYSKVLNPFEVTPESKKVQKKRRKMIDLLTKFFSDENNRTALLLSLISGLSTGLGGLFIALFGSPSKRITGFMLAFASGVMIYVSVFDLIPESHEKIGTSALVTSVCFFL